jgi:hypothetical protein
LKQPRTVKFAAHKLCGSSRSPPPDSSYESIHLINVPDPAKTYIKAGISPEVGKANCGQAGAIGLSTCSTTLIQK